MTVALSALAPAGWTVAWDAPSVVASRAVTKDPVAPFGNNAWPLGALGIPPSVVNPTVTWSRFPGPLREAFRRAGWVLVNKPTPDHLMSASSRSTVEWLSAGSIRQVAMSDWLPFATWLHDQGIASLDQVDDGVFGRFVQAVNASGLAYNSRERRLRHVARLWAIAPDLPQADRIAAPPWEGEDIADYCTGERAKSNENTTAVIHPTTMGPLLVWAMLLTDNLADDIVRASERRDAAEAALPAGPSAAGCRAAHAYLDRRLRDGTTALPAKHMLGGVKADLSYLAAMHGEFHPDDLSSALTGRRDEFTLDTDIPRPCGSQALAKIDGEPWCHQVDWHDIPRLRQALSTAALVVTAYLTGARPAELLSLPPGSCPPPDIHADGSLHYRIDGRRYKSARLADGRSDHNGTEHVWSTIKPVSVALHALERLGYDDGSYLWRLPRDPHTAMDTGLAAVRIDELIGTVNNLADRLGRLALAVPPDPSGKVTLSRFRRTLAWHIRRLPGGRVALAVQYGHLSLSTGEGYVGLRQAGALTLLDREQASVIVDTLHGLADELAGGEQLSGPAAGRAVAAARKAAPYAGAFLTDRERKQILRDPTLRVFDNSGAFLICMHDPAKALCRIGRPRAEETPDLAGCKPECGNVTRTDGHMRGLIREIQRLAAEAASPLTSRPQAIRLQQRAEDYQRIADKHLQQRRSSEETP
jgi:hypothetical protein